MQNHYINKRTIIRQDIARNKKLYLLVLPVLLYYLVFCYVPMFGALIAFKKYSPALGIFKSPWVGLLHFKSFFSGYYCGRLIKNTLLISVYSIIFGFPMPIILALMLNEVKCKPFLKISQTILYLPKFISIIVICSLIKTFTFSDGIINDLICALGGERSPLLQNPNYFRSIYIISDIWQNIGWDSIIYVAALAGVDRELYEAATIDGAGKIKQLFSITIPSILPTIVVLLILKIGSIMNLGYEKIILLYNESIYETADVISSFIYRKGLQEFDWSYSTAVGLFNSLCSFILLYTSNKLSKKYTESSLW